jgi:hypothetical protein
MLSKSITLGGLIAATMLSMFAPGAVVLTVLQLSLISATVWYTYRHFGDNIQNFWMELMGDQNVSVRQPATASKSRDTNELEPAVAASGSGAETSGERNPS